MSINQNNTWTSKFLSCRSLIIIGFIVLFAFISFALLKIDLAQNPWILGDWLINFQDGGFKRRGLSGSFFFMLQDFTGISLIYLVYTTQIFLYALFFISFYKLLSKKHISFEYFVLVFSPVTLLFFFNDIASIGRKEIIIIALFSVNALWHTQKNYTNIKLILISLLLFFFTFWHELIFFFVPYFIILHLLHLKSEVNHLKYKINLFLIYFIPVFVSIILMYYFGSEINNGNSIEILHQRGLTINGGIFTWDMDSIQFIKNHMKSYVLYSIPVIYGAVPFIWHIYKHYRFKVLFLLIPAIAFSIPLFILSIDWGRWIAIHFILILILFGSKLKSENENLENIKNDSLSMRLFPNVIYISFFVLNLSFAMPHCIYGITYSRSYKIVKNVIINIYEILPNTRL